MGDGRMQRTGGGSVAQAGTAAQRQAHTLTHTNTPLMAHPSLPPALPPPPGIFVGLWLNHNDGDAQLLPGGFDGGFGLLLARPWCRQPPGAGPVERGPLPPTPLP